MNAYVHTAIVAIAAGTVGAALTHWLNTHAARKEAMSRRQYIGRVAHDLRTPLSTIKTASEIALLDPSLSRETRRTFMDTIDELDRFSNMIGDLLQKDPKLHS